MFIKKTLEEYFDGAAAAVEVPGGGSASAAVATLGNCMAAMMANFTLGKKKYEAVEDKIREILDRLNAERTILQGCIDEDAQAFLGFNQVYAMPKVTDEEKAARDEAMQKTLREALLPPLKTMRSSLSCLELLPQLTAIGNKNLISDAGVAAVLLRAGVHAARLNVAVNLKYIKDERYCAEMSATVSEIIRRTDELARQILLAVEKGM